MPEFSRREPLQRRENCSIIQQGDAMQTRRMPLLFVLSLFLGTAAAAEPAGRVELEIVAGTRFGVAMSFQEWQRSLVAAGIRNVRLRTSAQQIEPVIEVRGTAANPVYAVTGVLSGSDELVLPGARFHRGEVRQLAAWLDDLARRGPVEHAAPRVAFGLTGSQLEKVQNDLARPIGMSTEGVHRGEAVRRIAARIGLPLRIDGQLANADEPIADELSALSCGTALACILQPIGWAMAPRASADAVEVRLGPADPDRQAWPVGWPPQHLAETLPALYEFRNVNVAGVSAAKVLTVIGRQIKAPVLYDRAALTRLGIDPEKAVVTHPTMRTNYSVALRKMLFRVGLKFEVRVDEAQTPFLWISPVKPG
jgi:hypothetical protein